MKLDWGTDTSCFTQQPPNESIYWELHSVRKWNKNPRSLTFIQSTPSKTRRDAMCAVNFQSRQNFQFLWERLSFSWMIFIYYHDDCLWLFNRLSFSGINAAKWIIINTFGIILIFLIGNSSDFLLANKFFIFTFNFFFCYLHKNLRSNK